MKVQPVQSTSRTQQIETPSSHRGVGEQKEKIITSDEDFAMSVCTDGNEIRAVSKRPGGTHSLAQGMMRTVHISSARPAITPDPARVTIIGTQAAFYWTNTTCGLAGTATNYYQGCIEGQTFNYNKDSATVMENTNGLSTEAYNLLQLACQSVDNEVGPVKALAPRSISRRGQLSGQSNQQIQQIIQDFTQTVSRGFSHFTMSCAMSAFTIISFQLVENWLVGGGEIVNPSAQITHDQGPRHQLDNRFEVAFLFRGNYHAQVKFISKKNSRQFNYFQAKRAQGQTNVDNYVNTNTPLSSYKSREDYALGLVCCSMSPKGISRDTVQELTDDGDMNLLASATLEGQSRNIYHCNTAEEISVLEGPLSELGPIAMADPRDVNFDEEHLCVEGPAKEICERDERGKYVPRARVAPVRDGNRYANSKDHPEMGPGAREVKGHRVHPGPGMGGLIQNRETEFYADNGMIHFPKLPHGEARGKVMCFYVLCGDDEYEDVSTEYVQTLYIDITALGIRVTHPFVLRGDATPTSRSLDPAATTINMEAHRVDFEINYSCSLEKDKHFIQNYIIQKSAQPLLHANNSIPTLREHTGLGKQVQDLDGFPTRNRKGIPAIAGNCLFIALDSLGVCNLKEAPSTDEDLLLPSLGAMHQANSAESLVTLKRFAGCAALALSVMSNNADVDWQELVNPKTASYGYGRLMAGSGLDTWQMLQLPGSATVHSWNKQQIMCRGQKPAIISEDLSEVEKLFQTSLYNLPVRMLHFGNLRAVQRSVTASVGRNGKTTTYTVHRRQDDVPDRVVRAALTQLRTQNNDLVAIEECKVSVDVTTASTYVAGHVNTNMHNCEALGLYAPYLSPCGNDDLYQSQWLCREMESCAQTSGRLFQYHDPGQNFSVSENNRAFENKRITVCYVGKKQSHIFGTGEQQPFLNVTTDNTAEVPVENFGSVLPRFNLNRRPHQVFAVTHEQSEDKQGSSTLSAAANDLSSIHHLSGDTAVQTTFGTVKSDHAEHSQQNNSSFNTQGYNSTILGATDKSVGDDHVVFAVNLKRQGYNMRQLQECEFEHMVLPDTGANGAALIPQIHVEKIFTLQGKGTDCTVQVGGSTVKSKKHLAKPKFKITGKARLVPVYVHEDSDLPCILPKKVESDWQPDYEDYGDGGVSVLK